MLYTSLRMQFSHELFGILLRGRFSVLFHLFHYSIIYLYQYHRYWFIFLVIIQYYVIYFLAQVVPSFVTWDSYIWLQCPFNIPLSLWGCCCCCWVLPFCCYEMLQAHIVPFLFRPSNPPVLCSLSYCKPFCNILFRAAFTSLFFKL